MNVISTGCRYVMKTVFMDAHGQYLWAGVNAFEVVPSAASSPAGTALAVVKESAHAEQHHEAAGA